MRLFVAVDVDDATRDAATRLRARLARERRAVERALRWVSPDLLHLTLRFIGERDDLASIQEALLPPVSQEHFMLEWASPSFLPPHGRARVFHVAVSAGADALQQIADEVSGRLASMGIPRDSRPFTAHLTLARVRDGVDPGLARQISALVGDAPFAPALRMAVDGFVLYESLLSPRGPTYVARLRSPLR